MKLMAVFAVWLGLEKTERSLLQDFFRSGPVSFKNAAGWKCLGAFFYLSAYIRQVFNDKKLKSIMFYPGMEPDV